MTGVEPPPAMYNFPCGVVSGLMASVITQPFDVIKTRMQVKPKTYPTLSATLLVTIKDMGLKGLFTGFVPRATRRTLMAAFTWAFYEEVSVAVASKVSHFSDVVFLGTVICIGMFLHAKISYRVIGMWLPLSSLGLCH